MNKDFPKVIQRAGIFTAFHVIFEKRTDISESGGIGIEIQNAAWQGQQIGEKPKQCIRRINAVKIRAFIHFRKKKLADIMTCNLAFGVLFPENLL